jgi:hypothetical protein
MNLAQVIDQQKTLNAALQFSFPPFLLQVRDGNVALSNGTQIFFMDPQLFLQACQWYVKLQTGKVV